MDKKEAEGLGLRYQTFYETFHLWRTQMPEPSPDRVETAELLRQEGRALFTRLNGTPVFSGERNMVRSYLGTVSEYLTERKDRLN